MAGNNFVNWYRVLDVSPDASIKEIKDAWKKLLIFWQPDRNKMKNASLLCEDVNAAFNILSDEKERQEFDKELEKFLDSDFSDKRDYRIYRPKEFYSFIENQFKSNKKHTSNKQKESKTQNNTKKTFSVFDNIFGNKQTPKNSNNTNSQASTQEEYNNIKEEIEIIRQKIFEAQKQKRDFELDLNKEKNKLQEAEKFYKHQLELIKKDQEKVKASFETQKKTIVAENEKLEKEILNLQTENRKNKKNYSEKIFKLKQNIAAEETIFNDKQKEILETQKNKLDATKKEYDQKVLFFKEKEQEIKDAILALEKEILKQEKTKKERINKSNQAKKIRKIKFEKAGKIIWPIAISISTLLIIASIVVIILLKTEVI